MMTSRHATSFFTSRRRPIRLLRYFVYTLLTYYLLAYWITPSLWKHYEHHPGLEQAPKTAFTKEGIPGDALNIALIGSEEAVVRAFMEAGWQPADPVTFKTSARITTSALFGKPYPNAPVSPLYVYGRVEDLAFELPVDHNTRQRHHVRFWRSPEPAAKDGRPLWVGAATFDRSVGISHLTGKITHHIDADIDEERDKIIEDLSAKGLLVSTSQVTGVGAALWNRNGGGDKYYTDGEMTVGDLTVDNKVNPQPPPQKSNPLPVQAKNSVWVFLRKLFKWI